MMSLLTVSISFGVIFSIKEAQKAHTIEHGENLEEKSLEEQGYIRGLSALASSSVVIINVVLLRLIRMFAEFEKHRTYTNVNTSVAFKLTVARFLNSSLIILMVNWDNTG